MTTEEQLEVLMGGGADAERVLWQLDGEDAEACKELAEHLSCLACSTTIADAVANLDHALSWIAAAPRALRGKLSDARDALRDARKEWRGES